MHHYKMSPRLLAFSVLAAVASAKQSGGYSLFLSLSITLTMGLDTTLPVSEVLWFPEAPAEYVGSPSIAACPIDGSLVASHDNFGRTASFGGAQRSFDGGVTWTSAPPAAGLPSLYWATLFTRPLDNRTYAFGVTGDNSRGPAQIAIAASSDCGVSWTAASSLSSGNVGFSTGPTPVISAGGRLWRAFERNDGPDWPGSYTSLVMSAAANASDLLEPSAWTLSGGLPFSSVASKVPSSWQHPSVSSNFGWLEGNVVEPPDGSLGVSILLRVNSAPAANKAALLSLAEPNGVPVFVSWVDFPGGMSKFTVRRDAASGSYVTLSNYVNDAKGLEALVSLPPTCGPLTNASALGVSKTLSCCSISQAEACTPPPAACAWCHANARNVLVLSESKDLINWRVVGEPLLSDDTGIPAWSSELFTGFQYVDWLFSGADILAVIRAGYRGANAYHNSNRILFSRVKNWALHGELKR
jgi:hypothetical protein